MTASNINKRRTDLFCHNTTPNMPISLAIRISCSYPMVYGAVKFNNYLEYRAKSTNNIVEQCNA